MDRSVRPPLISFLPIPTECFFSYSGSGILHCSRLSAAARAGIGLGFCAHSLLLITSVHITQRTSVLSHPILRACLFPRADIFIGHLSPAARRAGQSAAPAERWECIQRLRRPATLRTPIPTADARWPRRRPRPRVRPQLRICPGSSDSSPPLLFLTTDVHILVCHSLACWLAAAVLPASTRCAPSRASQGAISRLNGDMLSQGISPPFKDNGPHVILVPHPRWLLYCSYGSVMLSLCCASSYPTLSLCLRACEPMMSFTELVRYTSK